MRQLPRGLARRLGSRQVVRIDPEIANRVFALGYESRRDGVIREARALRADAPPEAAWREVESIGGENGWYCMDWAWTLRGWADGLFGGIGNRRSRPSRLAPGERLDSWVVERYRSGGDLTLRSEWRMPRLARLGLHVRPDEGGALLVQWVEFHPTLLTLLYWWASWVLHRRIFPGLLYALAQRARRPGTPLSPHVQAR